MPELPEVETIRLGLEQTTTERRIEKCEVLLNRTIAFPSSPLLFCEAIQDQTIRSWHRRGKYLYAQLSRGYLGIHLRMTGQLRWDCQDMPISSHTRVRFWCDGGEELRFDDQRTFGQMWWVPPDRSIESVITGLQKLGAEPLSNQFTPEYLIQKLAKRKRPIKNALLDQSIVAGIGNIYADESLFLAGIHPLRSADSLTIVELEKLHRSVIQVLNDGLKYGGTTFSSYLNASGSKGNYLNVAWVFRRSNNPCRVCGNNIDRLKIGGRSSHFCDVCQPIGQ